MRSIDLWGVDHISILFLKRKPVKNGVRGKIPIYIYYRILVQVVLLLVNRKLLRQFNIYSATVDLPFILNAKVGNSCTSLPFVVDTGSAIYILPFSEKYAGSLRPTGTVLYSAS